MAKLNLGVNCVLEGGRERGRERKGSLIGRVRGREEGNGTVGGSLLEVDVHSVENQIQK